MPSNEQIQAEEAKLRAAGIIIEPQPLTINGQTDPAVITQDDMAKYGLRPVADAGGLNAAAAPEHLNDIEPEFRRAVVSTDEHGAVNGRYGAEAARNPNMMPEGSTSSPMSMGGSGFGPAAQTAPPSDTGAGPSMLTQQAPAAPQPHVVAAGWSDSRVPYHKLTRQHLLGEMGDEQDAMQRGAAVRGHLADQTADVMGQEVDRAEYAAALRAQKEDARQQHVQGQLAKMQEATDTAGKAEVNPDRYFQDKGTFGRIASAIGVALGGGIAAANGGRNIVADQVDSAIQRDIDAQKANISLKQQNVHNQSSMLGSYREAFGDERLADLAFEQGAREIAIQKAQTLAMQSQNPLIQANADALVAQMRQAQEKTRMDFERMAYVQAHLVGGAGAGSHINAANLVKMPDGRVVAVGTAQEGEKARGMSGATANIQANIDEALQIRKGASAVDLANPYSSVSKKLKSLKAETAQIVTVARGQGAMSKGDQEVADNAMGAMDGLMDNNDEVLRDSKSRWGQQLDRSVKAMGGEQVEQGYTRDAQGKLRPVADYVGSSDKPVQNMPKGFKPVGK